MPNYVAVALTVSLAAIGGVPDAGFAQSIEQPKPLDAALIVVQAPTLSQDVPAQAGTPPSEATQNPAPAILAIRTYPRQADGHGIKLSGYNASRWAEDWRAMRDPKKRDDIFDRLKYIPIDGKGFAYLTLSGEMRMRENYFSRPGLVDIGYRTENLLRLTGGADLHVGPLRFYGELAHGGQSGHNYAVASKSRNDLVVQEAFVELSGDVGSVGLGARYGRQEFSDGPAGLVSIRNDSTIHTTLNGVRGWAQLRHLRVGMFDFKQTRLGTGGSGDDIVDDNTRFSGVNFGAVLADQKNRKIFLDPFVWRDRNTKQRWGSVTAREERNFYGARLWGSLDKLTFDWTVNRQDGDFNGRNIDAWAVFAAQTYQLQKDGLKATPGIHFEYGSGGGTFGTGTVKAARGITSGSIAYSYQGVLNFTNLFMVSPNITVTPIKKVDMTFEYQHSARVSESDAVYRGSGSAYAGTQLVRGKAVADTLRLQATWKLTKRLSVVGRYEYFMPSTVLDSVGMENSHMLAGWVDFRF